MLVYKTADRKLVRVVLNHFVSGLLLSPCLRNSLNHHCSTKLAEKQVCFQEHVHFVSVRMLLC